ncbi:MAG: hypothetical protein AB1656_05845 [Candidatus Omnitrophota bacterium]
MRAIKLSGQITRERQLQVVLPINIEAGPIEVIILTPEEKSPETSQTLNAFLKESADFPLPRRSKQEIDRYLEEERNAWDF